jgi:hypothetical protein
MYLFNNFKVKDQQDMMAIVVITKSQEQMVGYFSQHQPKIHSIGVMLHVYQLAH